MKKLLLLLFVCAYALVSCSQDDEMFVKEVQAESILDCDSIELRSGGDFFDASNLIPLFEYATFSGGKMIDTYYSTTNKGSSFYDSQSGFTYTYQRQLGKIGRNPLPYKGYFNKVVYSLHLYYNPTYKTHKICLDQPINFNETYFAGFGYYKSHTLGYIVVEATLEDRANYQNGTWKHLYNCCPTDGGYDYRCYALSPNENPPSGWRKVTSSLLGIIVPN